MSNIPSLAVLPIGSRFGTDFAFSPRPPVSERSRERGDGQRMPQRDASGYIVEEESFLSVAPHSPFRVFVPPVAPSPPSTADALVVRLGQVQESIGHGIGRAAGFVERYLFSAGTWHFVSKYLFYPFLSGAFSATIAHLRRRT